MSQVEQPQEAPPAAQQPARAVFEPRRGYEAEGTISLDAVGLRRQRPGREDDLVRWSDLHRFDPGFGQSVLRRADGKILLEYPREAFGPKLVESLIVRARHLRWAREEAERAADPAAYERKQAQAETPPPSRAWIGWTIAGMAALAVAYGVWGVDALKAVAFTLVGLAVVLGYLWAVGSVATKLFGPTRLTDAVVFLALVALVAAMIVF